MVTGKQLSFAAKVRKFAEFVHWCSLQLLSLYYFSQAFASTQVADYFHFMKIPVR